MSEVQDDSTITPNSGVRLSVGLIAMLVLSFAYFLYARDEYFASRAEVYAKAHEQTVKAEIDTIKQIIKGKADKTDTADRFTGSDFRTYSANQKAEQDQFREFVRLQFTLTEKRNEVEHKALEQRIEHLDDDLNQAVDRIDNHYNLRALP